MRKLFVAFLALVGAAALFMPVREVAYADIEQVMVPEDLGGPRAARLRTALDPRDPNGDPDTVWIGHVYQSFATGERPGGVATMQPAGGYGPYHVGRGNRLLIRAGGTIGDNGTWDFDRFQAGETDSLFGWWPIARAYQSGASSRPDYQRPFFALDYGNQVNYVINQGGPVDANGNKRTFGVVGLWHRDGGNIVYAASDTVEDKDPITAGVQDEITNVQPVKWSPTEVGGVGSTGSAWMGLRSHGDLSHIDLVSNGGTGNPFNSQLLQYQGNNGFNQIGSVHANGTDHNFPGYGSQMDQMLYRDIQLGEGDGLIVNFSFSTNMSTGANTETGVRAGWFDKDPISNAAVGTGTTAPASLDGNFISSDGAGASAPVDSFMVYVGAPVNDAAAMLSNGSTPPVYDKKRRWFSEVLRLASACGTGSPCTIIGKQIGSYYGINPPTSVSIDVDAVFGAGVLAAIKAVDGPGNGGTVRLVFRVKTNRGYDDENAGNPLAAFDSGTRGAAIVDNVVVNGWAASNGNFEALNSIDNRTTTPPTQTWKSTGKPPAVYFHTDPLIGEGLAWDDPCGDEEDPRRICDMYGNIVNSGDHDLSGHKDGGVFGSNTQDRQRWFVSPTINLCASGNGAPGDPGNFGTNKYNAMGIDQEVAITTSDYIVVWTYYNAGHVNATIATANFFSVGWQSYPARQLNGNIKWGEARHVPAISFYGSPRFCADVTLSAAKSNSLIRTTNAENRPDSLRVYLHRISRCFSFTTLTATECSPTGPLDSGTYFDNISVGLVDGAPPSPVTMSIWNLINDAFPANRNDALVPGGLDTAAAQIRTGFNLVPLGGTRPNISGDSVTVTSDAPNIRLDMVFRIKPGPGNYVTIGVPPSGVLKRPDVPGVANKATPGDGSFFGAYMASEGEFSSTAQHTAPSNMAHGSAWNEHIWNSARMDTVETNIFPTGNNGSVLNLIGGIWRSTYHESDAKFSTLGITKNICYMPNPGGATNASNIKCNGLTGVGEWDVANYPPSSGWDGVTVTTKEHTKILPDGLLTPGSHVQYFFRRSTIGDPPSAFHMGPDTNFVTPQATEGSTDGHRWQQFGVLPDRWKDPAWLTYSTALSPACMLYVDWCDRRGDERVWVGIADSIGATLPARYGAHNGWHARGDQDITVAVATDPTIAVYAHGGQPGSMWDMYGVKASESSTTSSSLGAGAPAIGLATGKDDARGPTPKMLRTYYRVLLLLTGDLNAGNIGPYAGKTSNDILLLNDFTAVAGGTAKPRYVWAMGRHFMEGQMFGGTTGHTAWPPAFFRATAVSGDYRFTTGFNQFEVAELRYDPTIVTGDNRYSVANNCLVTNDLLKASSAPGATYAKYPDTVDPLPTEDRIASIYAPASGAHEGVTLVEGYRISQMGAFETLRTGGRNNYFNRVIISLYSGLVGCSFAVGSPVSVGENPNNPLVNFLALRSENPHRGGDAQLRFGITKKERVELKVYDVTGRLVKTLANREFAAGEHSIFWDGSNEDGQLVPRGVYFYQLRTPSFVSQKKLAVLKH